MQTIKIGDLVLAPGEDRHWRVVDLYHGKARIKFVGEAWTRFKLVPVGALKLDRSKRSTPRRAWVRIALQWSRPGTTSRLSRKPEPR